MKNSYCVLCSLALSIMTANAAWQPVPNEMLTPWGETLTPETTLREYPRPQLVRENWTCLNGLWNYAVTQDAKGTKEMPLDWDGEILVPFAIEAPLSGVGRKLEPTEMLWYNRTINVTKRPGERVLLHFGAVDFRAQVFIGMREVGLPHEGGSDPFTVDITDVVVSGENQLTIAVWDPTNAYVGGAGKQTTSPGGCFYTRVSGIWQTVWLEIVPETHITSYRTMNTDLEDGSIMLRVEGEESIADRKAGVTGQAKVLFDGMEVASVPFLFGEEVRLVLPKPIAAWTPESPRLYQLELTYGKDCAKGYFAMRTFTKAPDVNGILRFHLNGKPCYIQGPLDQGWWPDGLLTPPSEEAMKFDIRTLKDLGFNMMRKHIKVEPARYYYLCDTMGLMVLQDMPSGYGDENKRYGFYRREFKAMVDALRVFPCIVMWVPYNESWSQPGAFLSHCSLAWIKFYDPERLVDGPSGWNDFERGHERELLEKVRFLATDSNDMHNYRGPGMFEPDGYRVSFLGEFGGLGHAVEGHLWSKTVKSWGYGGTKDTGTREGLEKTYLDLMRKLVVCAENGLGGSVYTQTTDVELEINGYLTYDRKVLKFDKAVLRKAHETVMRRAELAATRKIEDVTIFPRESKWRYVTEEPAADWKGVSFDDRSWAEAEGGFGTEIPGASPKTAWTSDVLVTRRSFTLEKIPSDVEWYFDLCHDEDCEVYLNGVRVFEVKGYVQGYRSFKADDFAKALRPGENVLAVKTRQTMGGQFFDLGLHMRRFAQ